MCGKTTKNLGQFFTPAAVASFMCSLIDKPFTARVLEPCAGQGVFLEELSSRDFSNITAYELDRDLPNNSSVPIQYRNFLSIDLDDRKFDVIIGNPPYVRWKNIPREIQEEFRGSVYWKDKINGLSDLLYAFMYLCVDMLEQGGELLFITPLFWTETQHASSLRKFLLDNGELELFITFNEMRIFREVSSTIMIFKYVKRKTGKPFKVVNLWSKKKLDPATISSISAAIARLNGEQRFTEGFFEAYLHPQFRNSDHWRTVPPDAGLFLDLVEKACTDNAPSVPITKQNGLAASWPLIELFEKKDLEILGLSLKEVKRVSFAGKQYYIHEKDNHRAITGDGELTRFTRYVRLGDFAEIGNGMVSGLDKAFKITRLDGFLEAEKQTFIPVIKAADLREFFVEGITSYIFVNDIGSEKELVTSFPGIFRQLSSYKSGLEKRYNYGRVIPWWHWVFLRNKTLMEAYDEKIFVPCKERIDTKGHVRFALACGPYYATQDVTVIVKRSVFKEDSKYLLALLNSDVILTWLKHKGLRRGGVLEFSERPLASIPVRLIDWNDEQEVNLHGETVNLVEELLETRKTDHYKKRLEPIIEQLYGVKK